MSTNNSTLGSTPTSTSGTPSNFNLTNLAQGFNNFLANGNQEGASNFVTNQVGGLTSNAVLGLSSLLNATGSGGLTAGTIINGVSGRVLNSVSSSVGLAMADAAKSGIKNISKGVMTSTLKGAVSSGLKSAFSGPGGITMAANIGTSLLGQPKEYQGDKGTITKGLDTAYDTIANTVGTSIPVLGAAMAANKFAGAFTKKLGGGTDGMTNTDAILGSLFFQMTPLGMVNGFGGKSVSSMAKDTDTWDQASASYGGSANYFDKAMGKQGKKYGTFSGGSRRKALNSVYRAGRMQNTLGTMAENNNLTQAALGNTLDNAFQNYENRINGGYDLMMTIAARRGTKLFTKELLEKARRVKQLVKKVKETDDIDAYKEGGSITKEYVFDTSSYSTPFTFNVEIYKEGGQMNVIPEGALHARLHHMEEESPELKGLITLKGIPVVVESKGGEVELQAEIEVNEIIFNKEVTSKLEEFMKKFNSDDISKKEKDEIAIKAGQLLAKEIIENTDDRTGLLNTI